MSHGISFYVAANRQKENLFKIIMIRFNICSIYAPFQLFTGNKLLTKIYTFWFKNWKVCQLCCKIIHHTTHMHVDCSTRSVVWRCDGGNLSIAIFRFHFIHNPNSADNRRFMNILYRTFISMSDCSNGRTYISSKYM